MSRLHLPSSRASHPIIPGHYRARRTDAGSEAPTARLLWQDCRRKGSRILLSLTYYSA